VLGWQSSMSSYLHARLSNGFQSMLYGPSTVYDLSGCLLEGSTCIFPHVTIVIWNTSGSRDNFL
jgi:hypothetical protein